MALGGRIVICLNRVPAAAISGAGDRDGCPVGPVESEPAGPRFWRKLGCNWTAWKAVVGATGVEPARIAPKDPKSFASANSATRPDSPEHLRLQRNNCKFKFNVYTPFPLVFSRPKSWFCSNSMI